MTSQQQSTHAAAKNQTYEISYHEEILRKRFAVIGDYAEDKLRRTKQKNDRRLARLERKIARVRRRREAQIARHNASRLFVAHRALYQLLSPFFALGRFGCYIWLGLVHHRQKILTKRPHESFRMTPRAKTRRGIIMSGYFDFVGEVWHLIWSNKWLFAKFLLIYMVFAAIVLGVLNQQNFISLRNSLDSLPDTSGIAKNVALFSGAVTGFLGSPSSSALQQVLGVALFLYGWLTLVWLFRALLRGEHPKLRDGLYNGGGAVLSMVVLAVIILLQLIPMALAMLVYSSLSSVGIINSGVMIENMAAWCALAVAALLTLYWLCSSLIALVIVTLPGVYPLAALRAAGDLVTSRRLNVVLRLVMMAAIVVVVWLVILMPMIWLDGWLTSLKITWLPLVPIVVAFLSTVTIIFVTGYIYLLYRRMVDDPTPPIRSDWQLALDKKRSKRQAVTAAKKLAKYAKKGDNISTTLRQKLTNRANKSDQKQFENRNYNSTLIRKSETDAKPQSQKKK